MSPLFLRRIFEEHVGMKKGAQSTRDQMDLTEFTDFVLAWDHRSNPAAIKYFFPIFDVKKQGKITPHELYIFMKEIHIMWVQILGEYAGTPTTIYKSSTAQTCTQTCCSSNLSPPAPCTQTSPYLT